MATHRIATAGWLQPEGTKQRIITRGYSLPLPTLRSALLLDHSVIASLDDDSLAGYLLDRSLIARLKEWD